MARRDPRHPSPVQASATLAELREKVERMDIDNDYQRLALRSLEGRISNNETRNQAIFIGVILTLGTLAYLRKLKGAIPA